MDFLEGNACLDRYGDEKIEVETSIGKVMVRRFVYEHAEIFRTFMRDCWTAGLTISGTKSAIGMRGIEIVGFLDDEGVENDEESENSMDDDGESVDASCHACQNDG